eukprot:6490737-Amphidinium_carterae.1
MRSSFARVLKDFMKVPDQKVSVLQGEMVVVLNCGEDSPKGSQAMASGSIYAHLSLLYFSPYKLVVQPFFLFMRGNNFLRVKRLPIAGEAKNDLPREIFYKSFSPIEATNHSMNDVELLGNLDPHEHWHLEFYVLVDSSMSLSHLQPQSIWLQKLHCESQQFWPPKAKKRKAQTHHGWDVLADKAEESDASEVDDDDDDDDDHDGLTMPLADSMAPEGAFEGLWEDLFGSDDEIEPQVDGEVNVEQVLANPLPAMASCESVPVVQEAKPKRVVADGLSRQPAIAEVKLDNGRIAMHISKSSLECVCVCCVHPRCSISRTVFGKQRTRRTIVGRRLGLMAAWLSKASDFDTKEAHTDKSWWEEKLTHQLRSEWRGELQQMESSLQLLAFERDLLPDEEEEQESLQGYI